MEFLWSETTVCSLNCGSIATLFLNAYYYSVLNTFKSRDTEF